MADPTAPAAASLYRGVRATVTAAPDGSSAWLALSVKRTDAHWAEWDSLIPARRVDLSNVQTTREALYALAEAISAVADALA